MTFFSENYHILIIIVLPIQGSRVTQRSGLINEFVLRVSGMLCI